MFVHEGRVMCQVHVQPFVTFTVHICVKALHAHMLPTLRRCKT